MYFYYLYISSPITEIQNGNDRVSKENTPSSKKGSGWTGNVRGQLGLGKVTEGKGRSKYETENTC